MILYIAEKPSLGRAIAAALPRPQKKEDGCIWLPNGDCVSWCIGHLLEQAEPAQYNPEYKSWNLNHLPIVPEQWQWQEKPSVKKQISLLRKLIKQAGQIVHAGDPDREGQLLVDEILHYLKVPATKLKHTQRLLISDLTTSAVKKALNQLRPNSEFAALSRSALARSRADWLFGINMTRAYTLRGRQGGYQGVLSVGRVQTPVLGLVVKRDRDIEAFEPKDFYQVLAHIVTPANDRFTAKWVPSEACQPYMDEENRVLSKALASNVVERIHNQPATVHSASYQKKRQKAPLPFNLSALQIDAARIYGLSPQTVLDICQSLYEKHQLITYPRSDCRHLPTEQIKDVPQVIEALHQNVSQWQEQLNTLDLSRRSKAWNDKEIQAHHAIIPTGKKQDLSKLSTSERQIYELVSRQYAIQFSPDYEFLASQIELIINGGKFVAKGQTPLHTGWKDWFPSKKAKAEDEESEAPLPRVNPGDELHCERGELLEKVTTPPAYFTDATLLAAMTGISRYVTQPDIRAILKETDGLGTEATRAGILELLFKRGFLLKSGKQIRASDIGKALIDVLPELAVTPDMTAQWEASLNRISREEVSYQSFMNSLEQQLHNLIQQASSAPVGQWHHLPTPERFSGRKKAYGKKTSRRSSTAAGKTVSKKRSSSRQSAS